MCTHTHLSWTPDLGTQLPLQACVRECSVTQLCPTLMTPWTTANQSPPSMGFPRQYWSALPIPSPWDLPLNPTVHLTSNFTIMSTKSNSWSFLSFCLQSSWHSSGATYSSSGLSSFLTHPFAHISHPNPPSHDHYPSPLPHLSCTSPRHLSLGLTIAS